MSINITEPYRIDGGYAVRIKRRNGSEYRVVSPDYQSIIEYKNEFLDFQKNRAKTKGY